VAISEVWYRLAALCALAACPDAGSNLKPLQVGVGVSGGSQLVGPLLSAPASLQRRAALQSK
jgi:hypothetical protein